MFRCLLLLCPLLTLFVSAVLHEGSTLPQPEDIINDECTFLSSEKMTPSLFWFKTKLAKAITNSFWDPCKRKVDDYYSRVNSHDKAMGLWALNYVRTEKMVKKENDEQEQDGNSCNTNEKKRKKQDSMPRVRINTAAITVFSGYLRRVNAIRLQNNSYIITRSDIIRNAIYDERKEKSQKTIEINEEEENNDNYDIPDASEYMQAPWEAV